MEIMSPEIFGILYLTKNMNQNRIIKILNISLQFPSIMADSVKSTQISATNKTPTTQISKKDEVPPLFNKACKYCDLRQKILANLEIQLDPTHEDTTKGKWQGTVEARSFLQML